MREYMWEKKKSGEREERERKKRGEEEKIGERALQTNS